MGTLCASSRLGKSVHYGSEKTPSQSQLVEIVQAIVTQIYPVRPTPGPSRQAMLADLDSRLDRWHVTLPEDLQYDTSNNRCTPPPHILFLHLRYWSAVLLLHRAL
jgi:hypothetical protein